MTETEVLLKEIGIRKILNFRALHKSVLPLVRGFYVSRCIEALDICGAIDILRSEGSVNINRLIQSPGCEKYSEHVLVAVCEYMYSLGILLKTGDEYRLTKVGDRLCKSKHGFFHFVQAYGPIFYDLPDLVMGKKVYGKEVKRVDSYVAKATAEISEWVPLPAIRRIIRNYGFASVLDLGCGRGELLLSLCSKIDAPVLRGVDIASDSVADGIMSINKAGLADRITLKVADITNPATFESWLKEAQVITLMFVLHEFAKQGEQFVVDFLSTLRNAMSPNAYILIAETPLHNPEQIRKRPTAIAEHHLFHKLSNQGILGAKQLRDILSKSGFSISEDLHIKSFSQHYILAK